MEKLIASISGIRGVVGEGLYPDTALKFSLAFGTYLRGGKVIVGRDTRITGEMMRGAVISGLLATGCEVTDIGIAPTPTVQYVVKETKADGGVVITASHNPIEWNALKFYRKGGILVDKKEGEKILQIYKRQEFKYIKWRDYKKLKEQPELVELHLNQVIKSVNVKKIKKMKFNIGVDSCNASGSYITPVLLEELGCKVEKIFAMPDGYFPHPPEPNKRNLKKTIEYVKKKKFDTTFVQDSDADRLAIIDENGNFLSEELTVALAVYHILKNFKKYKNKYKKKVVVNLSTSRVIDDIAREFNAKVYRTPVGEINVVKKLISVNGVIGGEGNGGVIFPEINFGRDSLTGIGLILELMADENKKISEIVKLFPQYFMIKDKIEIESRDQIPLFLQKIEKKFSDGRINKLDGIRVDYPDFWIHVRGSNTEPIIRIIIEAKSKKILRQVKNELSTIFK